MARRRTRNDGLDPEADYLEIYRNLAGYEFPWDLVQSLSFALFRTFAVPSIGGLLGATGSFTGATQQRYDDTTLLLEAPLLDGFDGPQGRTALRRINQMHRMYDIANEDMVYVLSTFVVVPKRWIDEFGWRPLTDDEVTASVRYYQALGRRMGIKEIPSTYDAFAALMDRYEAAHFGYDPGARAVADATMRLLTSFYPRPLAPLVGAFSRALMDDPLLRALGYRPPHWLTRWASTTGLSLRGRLVAFLPPRRKPQYVRDMRRIRSYPDGFVVEQLGTFAPGCPVRAQAAGASRPGVADGPSSARPREASSRSSTASAATRPARVAPSVDAEGP